MTTYDVRIAIATGKTRAMSGDLTLGDATLDQAKAEVEKLYRNGHAALCNVYERYYDADGKFHYNKVTI